MRYVTYEGLNLTGSYLQDVHPDHADSHLEITEEQAANWPNLMVQELTEEVEGEEGPVTVVTRTLVPRPIVAPVVDPAAAYAAAVKHYDGVVQGQIDAVARSFGYGDPNRPEVSPIIHAVGYAEEPSVPKFQAEGKLLRAWRSLVWKKAAEILAEFDAGTRPAPTDAELLAEIAAAAPAPTAADVDAELAAMGAA